MIWHDFAAVAVVAFMGASLAHAEQAGMRELRANMPPASPHERDTGEHP